MAAHLPDIFSLLSIHVMNRDIALVQRHPRKTKETRSVNDLSCLRNP